MTTSSAEAVRIAQAIDFAAGMADEARTGVTSMEAFTASLTSGEVTGRPLELAAAAHDLYAQIGLVFDRLHTDLNRHRVIAEAYAAVGNDAGNKAFLEGESASDDGCVAASDDADGDAEDDVSDVDDDAPQEPEVFTTCWDCEDTLEKPTTREEDAFCEDCDPDKPLQYWLGALRPNGKKIDPDQAESYRKLKHLAEDALDMVLEWETPYGDTFISVTGVDGSVVDAREWIERPENLALAGGRDQYAGRGEFDPSAPNRCWIGQTLPSGRLARPLARSYDDVAELATEVCRDVFERDKMDRDPYTVMLPGGELVDGYDWAQRPETRRLASCTTVRNNVRFRATGTCNGCGASLSTTTTNLIQGEIGEQTRAAAALYCDTCDRYLSPVFVPITLVDDASAIKGAPPRLIGDVEPER